ncbi:MAG TPA: SET domain-containing protein [Candidatus Paceibacterota bacterium]
MARKFTPGAYRLKVKRSKTGLGIFAEEKIPKGACIIEYIGKRATKAQLDGDEGRYLFDTGSGTIDGYIKKNTARYINHSCVPNCEADGPKGKVFIMALRTIKPGEELTYDYGEEYFERYLEGECACPKHAKAKAKKKQKTKTPR